MVKRQKLDYSVRQIIVKLHKEKHTIREISEEVKCSKSVVGRVVKSYNDTGKIVFLKPADPAKLWQEKIK